MTYCPVCGYDLEFVPWDGDLPADEICPSCGIQFGLDDAQPDRRHEVYQAARARWVSGGMQWWSRRPRPPAWDPAAQLTRVTR